MSITVTRLQIRNFEGIEALDIEPEALTILRGRNGSGKTSTLEAVMAAITNGAIRAKMVRDGADSGMILVELSNGMRIQREVTSSGRTAGPASLTLEGRTVRKPQGVLGNLFAGYGFNPVAFIDLPPDKQMEEILRVTNLDLARHEALRLSGGNELPLVNYSAHPLQVLKQIEGDLYDHRRDTNRDAGKLRSTAEKMRADVDGIDIDVERLRTFSIDDVTRALHYAERQDDLIQKRLQRKGEIDEAIRQLEKEQIENDNQISLLKANPQDTAALKADVETYQRDRDTWRTLQDAKDKDDEAEVLEGQSKELTTLIEETRAKPAELLRSAVLPVDGLAIDDEGNVTINGLPISELSTGEQLMIAVSIAIATLPEGGLRIVLVDGLEKLDERNRAKLLARMAQASVQVLATEVGDGELTVITNYGDAGTSDYLIGKEPF
jgi:energy-coupling factor transporter ATP-binding protein EcfA2